MARLPIPGGDEEQWGNVLNAYLSVVHQPDGTLKNASISETALDTAVQTKLNSVTTHTHPVAQVSDSTAVGRSVLTATNAAAARSAIGAGTSDLSLGSSSSTALAGDTTAADIGGVTGTGISAIVNLSQATYDALPVKDPATLYIIT